jgi:hypothetical protein
MIEFARFKNWQRQVQLERTQKAWRALNRIQRRRREDRLMVFMVGLFWVGAAFALWFRLCR